MLVLFSGFWLPTAHRYAARRPGVRVHACHVDSVASPSFVSAAVAVPDRPREADPQDVWLLEERDGGIARTIPVDLKPPVPWHRRSARFLVHGGGWGMGTYAARSRELGEHGLALDIVAYEPADIAHDSAHRYFMIDPEWHPWQDTGFPPFGAVPADGTADFQRGESHHASFHLTREATAVVSKPGGGTLMDSLAAATPVVLLEPFGDHEARNADLWRRLGFGIPYHEWRNSGWSVALLERLHRNLLDARARTASYAQHLIEEAMR
ncbi:hypothetical protein [Streptomyces sp.]|uniref:hypothetical protein n=1 Tax=Streptomyces sp. TaxID=1931 RepID=UPI0025EBAC85|nr:hypothetical protein [Streptomyces sp.]